MIFDLRWNSPQVFPRVVTGVKSIFGLFRLILKLSALILGDKNTRKLASAHWDSRSKYFNVHEHFDIILDVESKSHAGDADTWAAESMSEH